MLLLAVAVSQLTCKLLDPANFAVVLSAVAMQRYVDRVHLYLQQPSHLFLLYAISYSQAMLLCSLQQAVNPFICLVLGSSVTTVCTLRYFAYMTVVASAQ